MSVGDRYRITGNSEDCPHYLKIGEIVTELPYDLLPYDPDDEGDKYRLVHQSDRGLDQYVLLADLEPIPERNPNPS